MTAARAAQTPDLAHGHADDDDDPAADTTGADAAAVAARDDGVR
jgi:hypothetical protein